MLSYFHFLRHRKLIVSTESLMEKKSFVKASGAIHITNKVSLIQKKVWNFLLMKAYDELGTKEKYQVALADIYDLLGTRNDKDIKKLIGSLNILVQFNILDKDNINKWGVYSLLGFIDLTNGVLTYSFGNELRQLLHKPQFYTIINLAIQQKFSCKYSLFLYELCLDYIGIGKTPWIEIDKFRYFMGIDEDEYLEFKFLSQNVIQKAVREINKKSDLIVEAEVQRLGRKAIKIRFSVTKQSVPAQFKTNANYMPATKEITDEQRKTLSLLISAGIEKEAAHKVVNKYDLNLIRDELKLLNTSTQTINNRTGWFIKACENKWHNYELDQQKLRAERERKENQRRELFEKVKAEHSNFKEEECLRRYSALSSQEQRDTDIQCELWIKQERKNNEFSRYTNDDEYRITFLQNKFLKDEERDLHQWARLKEYEI